MEWEQAIAGWRSWMQAAGRPQTTVKLRCYQMRRFAEEHPLHTGTGQMVDWLSNPGWAPDTKKSYRSALVSFYGWAAANGVVDVDPTLRLPSVRTKPHPARPAPEVVVKAGELAADPRTWLMLQLAARHGLRRGEIARVHSDDVTPDLAGWSLRVHGKGDKLRVIPLADATAAALLELPAGWAFPSPYGGHLTEQHVGKLIARVLPGQWTAHPLRHRFATTAYAGTRDLLAVQEMLGHSRPETTRGYIQMPQDALRAALAAAA